MKQAVVTKVMAVVLGASVAQVAFAHDAPLRPAKNCSPVSESDWRNVRNGMTLSQAEHALGCHASHLQTNTFKTFTSDVYLFIRGSEHLASVAIRDGKVWRKRMH